MNFTDVYNQHQAQDVIKLIYFSLPSHFRSDAIMSKIPCIKINFNSRFEDAVKIQKYGAPFWKAKLTNLADICFFQWFFKWNEESSFQQ